MKFQPERIEDGNAITAHTASSIAVNQQPWAHSIVVPFRGAVAAWPCASFEQLTPSHFEALLAFDPELVIVGSGRQHRFVAPMLMRSLIERGIGVECMDTPAACRTYNVLVSEHRKVVAALLLD